MDFRSFTLSIFIILLFSYCTSDPQTQKEKEDYQNQSLISAALNGDQRSDCVYCSDTRAFEGNCSCYKQIPVFSCAGIPSGKGKSNSYKISCDELVELGTWTQVSSDSYSCSYLTCPPEAYRAAFTEEGK
ncbi:hypothetical protein AB3N61_03945 [Leptospira sp. WS58.C1]|uniref:hypothetical protein n=1 Tax=Leptospira TaxID=171 RepID=UPI0002BE8CB6|nr:MULTISPECIES: hypothetical protein [unclassified Leptospira]EMJ97125.1 hypothetical protein LEP1GSC192_3303 [Leptospira sp. B5-022]MCR1792873.1 hypothetical protein [Leptospira sp. id769339]